MMGSAAWAAGVAAAKSRKKKTARRIKAGAAYRALQKCHRSAEEQ
jgi:hypothetical protein